MPRHREPTQVRHADPDRPGDRTNAARAVRTPARLLLAPAGFDIVARRTTAVAPVAEAWDVAALVRERLQDGTPRPAPPASADGTAAACCPSCLAEYRAGFSRCSDCDAPLEPYAR